MSKFVGLFIGLLTTSLVILSAHAFELSLYPNNYEHSRLRFIQTAQRLITQHSRGQLGEIFVPSQVDSDLTTDYLFLPAKRSPQRLLVLISGVHGVEAFAGSALQQLFLETHLPRLDLDNTGVLLIHAVNPYGFKYLRRATESNVDMNRNLDTDPRLFKTENKGYQRLAHLLGPVGPVSSTYLPFLTNSSRLALMLVRGQASYDDLIEAVAGGQYQNPQGIMFGGQQFEPQVEPLADLLRRTMRGYQEVYSLDFHTGLGVEAGLHLITDGKVDAHLRAVLQSLLGEGQKLGMYELTTGDSPGFYHTSGDVNNFVAQLGQPGQLIVPFTVEFGTLGNGQWSKLQTINRLILETQGHFYGFANADTRNIVRTEFLELFYPSSDHWKQEVLRRGDYLFEQFHRKSLSPNIRPKCEALFKK